MKRSNRILAMLLALVMCIGMLAACGFVLQFASSLAVA